MTITTTRRVLPRGRCLEFGWWSIPSEKQPVRGAGDGIRERDGSLDGDAEAEGLLDGKRLGSDDGVIDGALDKEGITDGVDVGAIDGTADKDGIAEGAGVLKQYPPSTSSQFGIASYRIYSGSSILTHWGSISQV